MLKTKRQISDDLKLIDVVLEILDARIPVSSQNPDIAKVIKSKKHIILLNKSDLAEENENKKWVAYFKSKDEIAIITDANLGKGIQETLRQVENIMKEDMSKAALKGIAKKKIRLMIIGIPNVGKSSFINRICNRKSAIVGNKPGVTKQKQWVSVSNNIELLDTPGVLWPKFEDEKTALNLAFTGTIKDELIDKAEIAYQLLKYMYKNYKNNLFDRYKLTEEELNAIVEDSSDDETDKIYNLMKLIARKRGALLSGGNIDDEKAAAIILNDFRSGKLRQNYAGKGVGVAQWATRLTKRVPIGIKI